MLWYKHKYLEGSLKTGQKFLFTKTTSDQLPKTYRSYNIYFKFVKVHFQGCLYTPLFDFGLFNNFAFKFCSASVILTLSILKSLFLSLRPSSVFFSDSSG